VAAVSANGLIDISMVYHYIRGQDTIKLYMACNVLVGLGILNTPERERRYRMPRV